MNGKEATIMTKSLGLKKSIVRLPVARPSTVERRLTIVAAVSRDGKSVPQFLVRHWELVGHIVGNHNMATDENFYRGLTKSSGEDSDKPAILFANIGDFRMQGKIETVSSVKVISARALRNEIMVLGDYLISEAFLVAQKLIVFHVDEEGDEDSKPFPVLTNEVWKAHTVRDTSYVYEGKEKKAFYVLGYTRR